MRTFASRLVGTFVLLTATLSYAGAQDDTGKAAAPSAAESWDVIRTHFDPPAAFASDFGPHRSPLLFDDDSTVQSPADWKRRRIELLDQWTTLLGQWPPLITQPQVDVLETERRENFVQHKIRFLWTPNELTTAYLLIPDGAGKRPAVLSVFYEPETAIGFNNPHRDFALQLARRGFVTLSIGTTEASEAKTYALYYPDIDSATVQPLSMLGYAAANAWHVLASRSEVDAERIGIVGHSFGGKWAMFAGCLFDKFAAVAVSDPGIMFDVHPSVNYWEPWYLGWHPRPWRQRGIITEANPGRGLYLQLLEQKRDLHELHALMAPRPFLVSGGAVDPPSRWRALNHLVQINETLGYRRRVGMTNRPDHSPNEKSNAVIYGFFDHFLRASDKGRNE
ncbi:MAG: dienelactone hydrolase family protein [Fuerstiella sp.]